MAARVVDEHVVVFASRAAILVLGDSRPDALLAEVVLTAWVEALKK